jgi:hypothetical protein
LIEELMVLKRNFRALSIALLITIIIVPAYISLVSSSTGYIRINSKSASIPNQQVQAGGNVNLYFGDVTWSGSQLYLLMSYNNNPQVSTGDVIYTPIILISDLTDPTTTHTYTSGMGAWIVGNNWINGSIAPNIPVGDYAIKAFDNVATNAAVTDTYITVYSLPSDATLQVSPPSGPGGVPVTLTGSGYPPSASVTIAYYDSTFGSWNFLGTATSNASGGITFTTEVPDLRRAQGIGDNPQTYAQVSYRSEINGVVYSYADYNQYARGLKRVGNEIANGFYGNGTNLASTVRVESGDSLTLSGKWFHPGVVYVRWDGVAVVGTVTSNEWTNAVIIGTAVANQETGYFETTVTIPTASAGEHYLAIEDSESLVMIKIYVSMGSLQISPPSGPGGVPVTLTGSGYPPSASVTLAYYDSTFGSWNFLGTATSNALGNITFTTEMPDLRKALDIYGYPEYTLISFRTECEGLVYRYADYKQYSRGLIRVGDQTASGLYGNGTNLASTVRVESGDSLTLSGRWFHPGVVYVRWDGTAVVGTVTSEEWSNAVIIGTAVANQETGYFETTVTIPTADAGEHYLSIEDSETNLIIKIFSETVLVKTPTGISISTSSSSTAVGFQVEISGSLRDVYGNGLEDETVLLSYSFKGTSTWTPFTSDQTDSYGRYSAIWIPPATGYFTVKAEWEGNATHSGSNNSTTINSITFDGEYVFSVESNSTISELFFNSTDRTLSFNAQGDSGTQGYAKIIVAKTLVTDLENMRVYLDGNQVEYSLLSIDDSWCLIINYEHSTHRIVLDLNVDIIPEFPPSLILAIFVTVALFALIIEKKLLHPKSKKT